MAFRVTITASGGVDVESKAARTSVAERGEPTTIVMPSWGLRQEVEVRTRAVIVCPRDRASSITSWPVLPVPPKIKICILQYLDEG